AGGAALLQLGEVAADRHLAHPESRRRLGDGHRAGVVEPGGQPAQPLLGREGALERAHGSDLRTLRRVFMHVMLTMFEHGGYAMVTFADIADDLERQAIEL